MKRVAATLFVAVLGFVTFAPPALAADAIIIRKLDFRAFPKVTISALVTGPTPGLDSFALRENGRIVTAFEVVPLGQTDTPVGTVLTIDISGSMRTASRLEAAKAAAKQFVQNKLANDQIAIVAFNDKPTVVTGFSNEAARLNAAIDGLSATGETALYDGVRTAATLFADRTDLQANIVLLSDGADTVSQNNVDQAQAAVLSAKATLFSVGLRGPGGGDFDAGSLTRLAETSGGRYSETTDPEQLKALYTNVQRDLQNQFEINYTSTATGSVVVSLATSGLLTTAGPVNAGSISQGSNTKPESVRASPFAETLGSSASLILIAGLACLAAAFIVLSVAAVTRRGVPGLAVRLRAYGPEGGTAFESTPGSGDLDLAQTALVRRAVEATARLAKGGGVLESLEKKLEQADVPIRPAEALFFYVVGLLSLTLVAGLLGGVFAGIFALIILGLAPVSVLNLLAARRRARFTSQLPDMLRLLASSLRAGFSLLQAADATADQVGGPMGEELRRVLVEARLGRPLELALADSAKRVQSPDYDWAVMAIGIQREVGGNLAELLSTVSETMVARERLRREVSTLTAEGRISAVVLGALPVAIGIVVYILNPSYMDPLLHRTVGQLMLVAALVFGIGGFVWMRKIIDIPI